MHHLVGLSEIAELLGLKSRQHAYAITSREDFPPPEVELKSGRVWKREAVEAWAKSTGRL